ncbi:hypothetical protein HELRODRAFT_63609, partial [Helobdella robusta]|uniref:Uncharacterized protein n=1 Tax=Helobdella robusta TaxID=6412 RepID=T1FXI1_HELRO
GALGSFVTCPLDVAKTRLQSSKIDTYCQIKKSIQINSHQLGKQSSEWHQAVSNQSLKHKFRHIITTEGYRALFKGLMPTLIGVAPSRAIYFTTYDHCKKTYTSWMAPNSNYEYSLVHLLSAASAGLTCTTATNPIWMVRTRLQLNNKQNSSLTTLQCIRNIYQQHGIRGFYKGLTASYFGVIETAIHFVIYEAIKAKIVENRSPQTSSTRIMQSDVKTIEFFKYMAAAAVSKTIATCIAYPHEVARTRMREENSCYRTFFGTLLSVWKEEGGRGLYRGLGTQLIKHIPNTAIVLATYEAVIYTCHKHGF